ncbi:PAS and ANTAR domain-containing protein [Pseudarthrobacter enclensis]|uniref:PAS and ANTAR domain-containing protein n=1 Tax=Pseudarthrobacter enclensis TaxID=993070 RepID=UPI003EE3B18A
MTVLRGPYTYSSALGDDDCVAGTYKAEVDGWKLTWSDGMYQLHGYRRGDVVPTLELLFSHKHPEDRPRCEEIVAQVARTGGYFCMYHRIIDSRGKTRRVLSSGEGILGPDGKVSVIEGVMVDLTSTLQRETEQTARDAVAGATSTRTVIDQARGILMAQLKVGSDDAFKLLVTASSHRNVKLVAVAAELVQLANSVDARQFLDRAVMAIQAESLGKAGAGAAPREVKPAPGRRPTPSSVRASAGGRRAG